MNFYESARFQYAAARLIVKLAQFRKSGKFSKKITGKSNFAINLVSQSDGSFNINIEDPGQQASEGQFVRITISDLVAYVSERVVEKIDSTKLSNIDSDLDLEAKEEKDSEDISTASLDKVVDQIETGQISVDALSEQMQDLVKRRVAEIYRERRLAVNKDALALIDFARSQKLIAMSAPLISEMATALRKSANTLEITSITEDTNRTVLFLDQKMAREIETAVVDRAITPILGDITQFNKENGWGKLKIEDGLKTVGFSIPYDVLPGIKQRLIDSMRRDQVYLQTYFVRDRSGEVVRLIAVGILPTPAI